MTNKKIFKISIEDESGEVYYFFTFNINQLLSSDFFNRKVMDAKTGDSFIIKEEIINKLNIEQPPPTPDEEYLTKVLNNYAGGRVELMKSALAKYKKICFLIRYLYEEPKWEIPQSYNKGKPIRKNKITRNQ